MYEDFKILLDKYLDRTISQPEMKQLARMLELPEHQVYLASLVDENFRAKTMAGLAPEPDTEGVYQRILLATNQTATGKIVHMHPRRRSMWKWIAAACILLAVGTIAVFSLQTKDHSKPPVATTHDVPAPKETRAVITLANGTKVYLDSVNTGTIAQQNTVSVTKTADGKIVYEGGKVSPTGGDRRSGAELVEGAAYNTLTNPRGSKAISLTLSDRTRVWLNSESSLKYPIAFAGNTREVEITGEAYFEVKHNAKQPFKVHLPNGSVVEDLGTAFNINAYADENTTKTTLVEGSIKVSSRLSAFVTKPKAGEQVIDKPNSPLTTDHSPDLEDVLAWKNGTFSFSDAPIETIMKEISRYYDAEIVYQDKIPGHFVADISRDVPVSKLLQILELTNRVHFEIEGKKIIVAK